MIGRPRMVMSHNMQNSQSRSTSKPTPIINKQDSVTTHRCSGKNDSTATCKTWHHIYHIFPKPIKKIQTASTARNWKKNNSALLPFKPEKKKPLTFLKGLLIMVYYNPHMSLGSRSPYPPEVYQFAPEKWCLEDYTPFFGWYIFKGQALKLRGGGYIVNNHGFFYNPHITG